MMLENFTDEAPNEIEELQKKIRNKVAQVVQENFGNDSDHKIPLFSEFRGFQVEDGISVRYEGNAEEYKFLLDLLKNSKGQKKRDKQEKRSRRRVLDSIRDADTAETFAIVSAMPFADEHCMTKRVDIVADIYSSYDDLKRLVATCRIIMAQGIKEDRVAEILDEYEGNRQDMFTANRYRIVCDKNKEVVQETLAAEAVLEAGSCLVRNKLESTFD